MCISWWLMRLTIFHALMSHLYIFLWEVSIQFSPFSWGSLFSSYWFKIVLHTFWMRILCQICSKCWLWHLLAVVEFKQSRVDVLETCWNLYELYICRPRLHVAVGGVEEGAQMHWLRAAPARPVDGGHVHSPKQASDSCRYQAQFHFETFLPKCILVTTGAGMLTPRSEQVGVQEAHSSQERGWFHP
jgi:hypothetical protein